MNQTTKGRPVPKFANPGRRARFSYVTRDRAGNAVREWHVHEDGTLGGNDPYRAATPEIAKSLRGMVAP